MEVRNRFKGLDLINRVLDALWTEVRDRRTYCQERGDRNQDHPHGIEMHKSKMSVWGVYEEKKSDDQRRKGKLFSFECRVPKNSKERKESLLQ